MSQLLFENRLHDYDQFVLVDTGLQPETTHEVLKAAAYDMRINKNLPETEKSLVYYKTDQIKEAIDHAENHDKEATKFVFFDDCQVNSNKKIFFLK